MFVNGVPTLIIIDPWTDINHASDEFCSKAHIHIKAAPYKVQLANKSTQQMKVTKEKVTMSLGTYSESFWIAANLLNYDVILRKNGVPSTT